MNENTAVEAMIRWAKDSLSERSHNLEETMVIGIFGENCSGKSTLANAIMASLPSELVTGRDYLRMARSESEAKTLFQKKLKDAVVGDDLIYVISEPEQLALLPDGAIRVLVRAPLDTIKDRFRKRMHGNLPAPIEKMLEKKHGLFDAEPCDYRFDGLNGDAADLCEAIKERMTGAHEK